MNRKEAIQLLAILKAAYPNFYKEMSAEEAQGTVSVWTMQFADLSADIVLMALNKIISTSKFPPTIAEVKEKLSSVYWEAHEKVYPLFEGVQVSEEEERFYARICEETERYKYKDRIEPNITQLVGTNNVKRLSEGETK